jgi:hypothetical protein
MYYFGLKFMELRIKYLAIGLLILGFSYDLKILMNVSSGLFFGMSVAFFFASKIQGKLDEKGIK